MGIFDRKASRNTQLADETMALRESIRSRGQAQIREAGAVVDSFVSEVLAKVGAANNSEARAWLLDRIRFFFVVMIGPQTFDFLKKMGIPELPELEAEYRTLARDPARYGAAHLVAWIWLLQRSLFEPMLQGQFLQMEGALVDAVRGTLTSGGDFASQFVDWNEFFRN